MTVVRHWQDEATRLRKERDANADAYFKLTHEWATARAGWQEEDARLTEQLRGAVDLLRAVRDQLDAVVRGRNGVAVLGHVVEQIDRALTDAGGR